MSIGIALGAGVLLGLGTLVAAFVVADQFELNLFHIEDVV